MNTDAFKSYRANTVRGSRAADIYIQCYDEIIRLLHAAARAIETGDIEKKTSDLNRVFTFILHLQAALDLSPDGEAARWLKHFYALVCKQISEGSVRLDPEPLRQAAGYFADVRKTWEEALAMSSDQPANNPAISPQTIPFRSPHEVAPTVASDMAEASSCDGWSA